MKTKILVLLLLAFSSVSIAQTTVANKLKINGNTTSTTAPFVAVIESNGEVNKIAKTDLIDVLNFASAVNLPTTGLAGKIYVTNDDNKIYRWNGTIYQPLAVTDISGKQNTLVSGTNIKTINGNSVLGSGDIAISAGGSTVNTAFTQKTFAASMSVAHDPANPNFFVNITGDFSLSITGTANGDSGIVNLVFGYVEGGGPTPIVTQTATLLANFNKEITSINQVIQVYFIHDESGLKWYRDEINGNLQNAVDAGSTAVKNGDISFESNNSAGGISRVSTTTNRVALENSNAQSQLGSSIASVFGSLTLTQGDFTKDKTTTVTVGVSNVNTQISFEGKTVAGNYVVKTRPLNSYTVATLPAAVLNDEATVTDATSAAVLTGGGSLTIPVWYNGTAWTKFGGGSGGSVSTLQAETIDFYNRTFTSGGIINQSDLLAIDKFIVDGKKSGWWQAQKDMCLFLKTNGGVASAIIKLKNTTNTTITNYNYTDADLYDFGLFAGRSGNTNKWLDLNVGMSSLGIDLQNFSISNFCTLGGTEDFRFITDQGPGFKFGSLISLANGNENIPFYVGFNGASQFGSVGGDGALHGTQIVSMNNVSNFEVINSINYSTNTGNAGTGMLNGNFVMSKKILDASTTFYGNIPLSFYSIGTNISESQAYDMSIAIQKLMLDLLRIVPVRNLFTFADSIGKGTSTIVNTFAHQTARKLSLNDINVSRGGRRAASNIGSVLSANNVYNKLLNQDIKGSTIINFFGTNDIRSLDFNSNDFGNTTIINSINSYLRNSSLAFGEKDANVIISSIHMFKDNFVNLSENKQLDYAKSYAAAAKTLYNNYKTSGVYFLNLFHLFKDSPEVLVLGDGIHPNELGHAVISKEIIRLLNSGAQRRKPSLSFGTITAAASNDISVTVLNAEVGMSVAVTPPNNLPTGLVVTGFVISNDTVKVRVTNITGGSIAVPDGVFVVDVKTGY